MSEPERPQWAGIAALQPDDAMKRDLVERWLSDALDYARELTAPADVDAAIAAALAAARRWLGEEDS